ncbi:MAG: nuclear transport factor 2 family protein [Rhodobacteraceae bacterium]|nr:nuclear transport factor 2 family protein [Paracoccaceae bacterium]
MGLLQYVLRAASKGVGPRSAAYRGDSGGGEGWNLGGGVVRKRSFAARSVSVCFADRAVICFAPPSQRNRCVNRGIGRGWRHHRKLGEFAVAIFEELNAAIQNRDAEAYTALYSDDAVFVRHQSGTEMNKAEFSDLIKRMMASEETDMGVRRCIYENEDILVLHSINDYPDGTREAVLMSCLKTDGRISRVETGATPLQK